MADYYTPGTPATANTLARAENIATELTTIKAAFDKIPEQVSLEQDRAAYALDTGVADAYLVAMPNTWTAYTAGASLRMKAVNANMGASTVNVDGLGVKTITRFNGDALLAGDIPASSVLEYYYDGTNFQLAGGPATITNAVIGPASATDNAIARFNGTSGKAVQNSGITIDDADKLNLNGNELVLDVDGDTAMSASDDDSIVIKIAGSNQYNLTASQFKFSANELVLDTDADTSIHADTDDRIDFNLGGVELFRMVGTVANSVNGIDFIGQDTGNAAIIKANGTDANVGLEFRDDNGNAMLHMTAVASAVNELTITNAATGNPPIIQSTGEEDIGIEIHNNGGEEILILASVATAVNELTFTNAATGNPALITASGETNVGIDIQTKGAGDLFLSTNAVLLNETLNGNMDIGLTINQGTAATQAFCIKQAIADLNTVLTTATDGQDVEPDDYFTISIELDKGGGTLLQSMAEDAAQLTTLRVAAYGGTASSTHTGAGRALVEIYASEHDGSNVLADITSDGNVFAVRCRRGGSDVALFFVDEDGDLHADGTLSAFDKENDVALCRALDLRNSEKPGFKGNIIKTEWDDWAGAHKERLIELKIVAPDDEKGPGFVNVTQLQRLHNGAICQLHTAILGLQMRLAVTESRLQAIA